MLTDPDDWTDDELAERCVCGHTLGQHEFGGEAAPCDLRVEGCDCWRYEWGHDYALVRAIARESARC